MSKTVSIMPYQLFSFFHSFKKPKLHSFNAELGESPSCPEGVQARSGPAESRVERSQIAETSEASFERGIPRREARNVPETALDGAEGFRNHRSYLFAVHRIPEVPQRNMLWFT